MQSSLFPYIYCLASFKRALGQADVDDSATDAADNWRAAAEYVLDLTERTAGNLEWVALRESKEDLSALLAYAKQTNSTAGFPSRQTSQDLEWMAERAAEARKTAQTARVTALEVTDDISDEEVQQHQGETEASPQKKRKTEETEQAAWSNVAATWEAVAVLMDKASAAGEWTAAASNATAAHVQATAATARALSVQALRDGRLARKNAAAAAAQKSVCTPEGGQKSKADRDLFKLKQKSFEEQERIWTAAAVLWESAAKLMHRAVMAGEWTPLAAMAVSTAAAQEVKAAVASEEGGCKAEADAWKAAAAEWIKAASSIKANWNMTINDHFLKVKHRVEKNIAAGKSLDAPDLFAQTLLAMLNIPVMVVLGFFVVCGVVFGAVSCNTLHLEQSPQNAGLLKNSHIPFGSM
eukprot:gnl/MRDRNA2_/MRDRNA2_84736_c0_seq1.p1 gnl/MRDRNA2_/MRDRNA2_84736_c0~~gnl/MRDRNA2_/MRDRNA2_84736_c0_seq1.p1  ORF type:complete len:410 (-),score=111.08 gnl/MRDRNA2_/MRDRNA2_84736_c0_seq1:128-1357(-)